jgi:hypothetical protein
MSPMYNGRTLQEVPSIPLGGRRGIPSASQRRREFHCKGGVGEPHRPLPGTFDSERCKEVRCPNRDRCLAESRQTQ